MQNVTFLIATLGIVVAAIVAFANGRSDFVSRFNEYVAAAGGVANALDIAQAQSGYTPQGFDWYQTFLSLSLPLYIVLYSITSSIIGGEVKNARKAQIFGMPGSVVYTTLWMVLLIGGFQLLAGYDLLGHIGAVDPGALGLGFTPTFIELAGAMVYKNLFLVLLLGVGFLLWTYVWLPINFLASTRILLAWSFDRLMPEKLAYVSPRFHTPVVSILVVLVLGEISLALYAWQVVLHSIVGIFGWILSFILTAIAAIVFPYRRREDFEASPVNWRIGSVPVMSIVGVLSLISLLICEAVFWLDPFVGLRYLPNVQVLTVGVLVAGALLYYLAKYIQRARGIRIEYAFREIPPE